MKTVRIGNAVSQALGRSCFFAGVRCIFVKAIFLHRYPHFLHQEAGVHVLGHSFAELVGEG